MSRSLTEQLVPHLPAGQRAAAEEAGPELEEVLADMARRVRDAYLAHPPRTDELLAHVAAHIPEQGELMGTLRRLHVEDLALAWACGQGHPGAMEQLERRHFSIIDGALSQIPDAAAQLSELKQQLRQRLFVALGDHPPRIRQYSGRGELSSWLRVAAIRCALNLLQKHGREVELEDGLLDNLTAPENQELQHLKDRYRGEFKQAFEAALASLTSRERNVLGYTYLERLTAHQLGAIYGVHRTTVARWLSGIRDALATRTRDALMDRLRVDRGELESIMRLIHSQLDASIERYLLKTEEE